MIFYFPIIAANNSRAFFASRGMIIEKLSLKYIQARNALFVGFGNKVSLVQLLMFSIRHYFKIGNIIVVFVLVNVMDMFFRRKLSPKMFLHYMAVLKNSFSFYVDDSITVSVMSSFAVRFFQTLVRIPVSFITFIMFYTKSLSFVSSFASLDLTKPLLYLVSIHHKTMNRIARALQRARVCPVFFHNIFPI